MLQRQVGAQHQDGLALVQIGHRGQLSLAAAQRVHQRDHIAGAVMVDVVGLQHFAREFLEVEVLLVAGVVGADHAEAAAPLERLVELPGHRLQSQGPRHLFQPAVNAYQRRLQSFRVIVEIEAVAALNAQKLAVDPGVVAVVAADDAVVARAQRGLAAIRAMRADGAHVDHFPGPRFIPVDAAGQRAHRADIDAGAALVALQVVALVGCDFGDRPAVDHAQRGHAHAFVADAHAAVAQDAARRVEEHHRRELLLGRVDLLFRVAAFARAIAEGHVLQFAFAALIAHRAIQRMVGEQELQHGFTRRRHLRRFRAHHHALAHGKRASRHQLGHLLHFHQAHAAGGLQRETFVVAERRNFDAHGLGGVDHQGPRRRRHRPAVYRELYQVSHTYAITGWLECSNGHGLPFR